MNYGQLFYAQSNYYIQRNGLNKREHELTYIKFLLSIMMILYMHNHLWLTAGITSGQQQMIIKTLSFLCNGMMMHVSVTIYLSMTAKYDPILHELLNRKQKNQPINEEPVRRMRLAA